MQFKNIVHSTTYTKDGQQKKKYTTVGTLFIYDDGGMSIKMDAIPVGFDGKLAVYDRDENKQRPSQQTSQYAEQPAPIAAPGNNMDDPSRHNVAGAMNKPAQHQTVPGTQVPLEIEENSIPF